MVTCQLTYILSFSYIIHHDFDKLSEMFIKTDRFQLLNDPDGRRLVEDSSANQMSD